MDYYGHMIVRLEGSTLENNLDRYLDFVRKGIAGFIVFGGELDEVQSGTRQLQEAAPIPLIIASDLEQGLGQQTNGGTVFPPAMALSSATDLNDPFHLGLVRDVYAAYAEESLYAGINTILAPVSDINTNPSNPVISVRSYGEDKITVSLMSGMMIEAVQSRGLIACAKHFPGHGDTDLDSHLAMPILEKSRQELDEMEIFPFKKAIETGVKTMMLGHISAPAIDPEGIPVSLSGKAVDYIRKELGFQGLLMTDALNMGGILSIGQSEASARALSAGVDILLHPDDPQGLNEYLKGNEIPARLQRIETFRKTLHKNAKDVPDFQTNVLLSLEMTARSIKVEERMKKTKASSIVIIKEKEALSSGIFESYLHERYPQIKHFHCSEGEILDEQSIGGNAWTVVFSETGPWKGRAPQWLNDAVRIMERRTSFFIIFGNPYVVHGLDKPKMLTYWCSEPAERAAVKKLENLLK